jgi:hypothetical protein
MVNAIDDITYAIHVFSIVLNVSDLYFLNFYLLFDRGSLTLIYQVRKFTKTILFI